MRWIGVLWKAQTRTWPAVLWALLALVGTWDSVGAQLVPGSVGKKWPRIYDLVATMSGFLPLWGWVIIALALALFVTAELALRQGKQHVKLVAPSAPVAPATAAPIVLSPAANLFFAVATDGQQTILTPDKWETVQFSTAVVDPGGHFDIQDSRFTSGGGSYYFEIGLDLDQPDKNAESYDLLLETSNGNHRRKYGPHDHLTIDEVVAMDIADSVTVKIRQNGGVAMTTIKSGGQWRCQLVGY